MRILIKFASRWHIALEVEPEGGALGAGAGEAEDNAAAVIQQDPQALAAGQGAIHRIAVAEVIGRADAAAGEVLAHQ